MRRALLVPLLFIAACSRSAGGSSEAATATVIVPADSLMRVATSVLASEGWTVNRLANGMLATAPRPLPDRARSTSSEGQQWMVQVSGEPLFRMSGSRLVVAGYIVPVAANMPVDTTTVGRAVPITSENALLWREVTELANRVARAAGRAR